jgi:hypothetical protein
LDHLALRSSRTLLLSIRLVTSPHLQTSHPPFHGCFLSDDKTTGVLA